jgi:NAD(P)-dependent dehydrogenase (short-subunit alcohol dehydrogenase family)
VKALEGKAAFVCGGTRGMNLAIARRYAEEGARVTVMSRDPARCAAAAAALNEHAPGCEALGIAGDARDYEKVSMAVRQAAEAHGPLDLVVAGQAGNFYAPATKISSNGFRAVVDIDLVGTFHVFRAAWDHLRRPGASLLAITAPEAIRAMPFQAHVCAAKAGVNMLVRCLALEWGPEGVRVNGLSPGPIEGSWGMLNVVSPTEELRERIARAMPLRRFGTEEEIAGAALYLATATYVTGTILDVDGGAAFAMPEPA